MGLTYKESGVDIEKADRFVSLITPLARSTFRPEVISDIGSFNALFKLDLKKYREPVLVSGTDGVGTKLKIAFMLDKHDTVGIDLVAMCVNDILTCGAEPLFFLDYIATGRLSPEKSVEIVKGIAVGCKEAGCSLIGGETAEMPGFYQPEEYDLCGFAVGVVEEKEIITGREIREGDIIIGITSSGLHSNGYSLVREIISRKRLDLSLYLEETGTTLGEALLKPTMIYVKAFKALKERGLDVKGMAHITGGGITGNLPRVFPPEVTAVIDRNSWDVPFIFRFLQRLGDVSEDEMFRTFNMGIGYIMIVPAGQGSRVMEALKEAGYYACEMGIIEKGNKGVRYV